MLLPEGIILPSRRAHHPWGSPRYRLGPTGGQDKRAGEALPQATWFDECRPFRAFIFGVAAFPGLQRPGLTYVYIDDACDVAGALALNCSESPNSCLGVDLGFKDLHLKACIRCDMRSCWRHERAQRRRE